MSNIYEAQKVLRPPLTFYRSSLTVQKCFGQSGFYKTFREKLNSFLEEFFFIFKFRPSIVKTNGEMLE